MHFKPKGHVSTMARQLQYASCGGKPSGMLAQHGGNKPLYQPKGLAGQELALARAPWVRSQAEGRACVVH